MSRRNNNHSESLDLLLDTICNLFGLIILITIIIAILAQVSAEETKEKITEQFSEDYLSEELESLTSYKDKLSEDVKVIQTTELTSAIITASKATRMLEQAKRELERRRMMLENERQLISDEQKLIQTLQGQEPFLREQIEMLESELKRSKELKDIQLRTPKRQELAEHMPVQIILKDNRVYIINDTTGWGKSANPKTERCRIWITWNPKAVDESKSSYDKDNYNCFSAGGQDIKREIYLLPNGGISIPTDKYLERDSDWVDFLDSLDPKVHVVSLKVDPDSFVGFSEVRRSLTKAGFFYDVTPKIITTPYLDRIKDDQNATAQ